MNILSIALLAVGITFLLGVIYFNRKKLYDYLNRNKNKIIAVSTGVSLLAGATTTVFIPEGYMPNTLTRIRCSDGNIYDFNAANLLTVITASNRTIELPAGTIELSSLPINMTNLNNISIRGQGINVTNIRLASGAANNQYEHMFNLSNCHNIEFYGITFDFNNWSQSDTITGTSSSEEKNLSVIMMRDYCSHIRIHDCSFWNGHGSFISSRSTSPTNNMSIYRCDFFDKRKMWWDGAINLAGSDNIVSDVYIEDMFACGIRIHGQPSSPQPTRNIITRATITGDIGHGIHLENTNGNNIFECNIFNINSTSYNNWDAGGKPYSTGIYVGGSTHRSYNNKIMYCSVRNVGYIGIGANGGYNDNNTVIGCSVSEVWNNSMIVLGSWNIISGNHLFTSNAKLGNYPLYGIRCISHNTITENIINATGTARFGMGIYTRGILNHIGMNTLNNSYTAIRVDANLNTIEGNMITSTASGAPAILLKSANFTLVLHNNMDKIDRGIRIYRSCNTTCKDNIIGDAAAGYSIYEDTALCTFNIFRDNDYSDSTTKQATIIGSGSNEIQVNATTQKIGIQTYVGWLWK